MASTSKKIFWERVESSLKDGRPVFLAMVVNHTHHSPGTTGAKLYLAKDEKPFGTIGGGIMEYNLIQRANAILENGIFSPEIQTLNHSKSGPEEKSGMICAGKQTNLYYLCQPEKDLETVKKIVTCNHENRSALLSIRPSGMTLETKQSKAPKHKYTLTQTKDDWHFEEQLQNFNQIAILGGGHCALALSRVMNRLGYDVSVFDTRNSVSTITENKYAQSIQIVDDFQQAAKTISYPNWTQIVVMTTDVASDVQGIFGALQFPFPFIGVMGSNTKIAEIKFRLKEKGILESQLKKLTMPVGIPMVSNTPEEIAISVAAQILQKRKEDEN